MKWVFAIHRKNSLAEYLESVLFWIWTWSVSFESSSFQILYVLESRLLSPSRRFLLFYRDRDGLKTKIISENPSPRIRRWNPYRNLEGCNVCFRERKNHRRTDHRYVPQNVSTRICRRAEIETVTERKTHSCRFCEWKSHHGEIQNRRVKKSNKIPNK